MFESLHIIDFQAHAKTKVTFDPRITTIVGASDVGKSSIIRALRWVCLNKPGGDSFIREGQDTTTVILTVDGKRVRRQRGKGKNLYQLETEDELVSFRDDVPPEIKKLLNVSDINVQQQHDAPFWFSETTGEVSRQLNQIVNLGIIDSVLGYLGGRLRDTTAELSVCEQRLEKAKEDRDRLKPILETDQALAQLESQSANIAALRQVTAELNRQIGDVSKYSEQVERAAGSRALGLAAAKTGDRWVLQRNEQVALTSIIQTAKQATKQANRVIPDIQPLEELKGKIETLSNRRNSIRVIIEDARRYQQTVDTNAPKQIEAERQLKKELGEMCPLCNQKIRS